MINSPIVFFIFLGLYPVIFLTSKNWFIYETRQLLFLLIVPVITGMLGAIGLFFLKKRSLIVSLGLCLAYPLFRGIIGPTQTAIYSFILTGVIVLFLIKKTGLYFINLVLLIMTLLAFVGLIHSVSTKSIKNDYFVPTLNKEADNQIKFKTTPNIYLIHLESYHSPKAMKQLYNFDNREFIDELESKDFFVSQNNFSNYHLTLNSVGSMFLQQQHYFRGDAGLGDAVGMRDVIGGKIYNPTLSILGNNGYRIVYVLPSTYIFNSSSLLDHYFPSSKIYDSLLIFQSWTIDKLHSTIANLQNPGSKTNLAYSDKDQFYTKLHETIDSAPKSSTPTFYFFKEPLEVNHTPAGGQYTWKQSDDGWVDTYKMKLTQSNPRIIETVERIIKNDPEAIVILYGDHGATRYRGIWTDRNNQPIEDVIYARKKISLEDLSLDLFGVFTAVRYPNGDASIFDGRTYVNLFRLLFSDLAGAELTFEEREDEAFIKDEGNIYKLVDDGRALEKAE